MDSLETHFGEPKWDLDDNYYLLLIWRWDTCNHIVNLNLSPPPPPPVTSTFQRHTTTLWKCIDYDHPRTVIKLFLYCRRNHLSAEHSVGPGGCADVWFGGKLPMCIRAWRPRPNTVFCTCAAASIKGALGSWSVFFTTKPLEGTFREFLQHYLAIGAVLRHGQTVCGSPRHSVGRDFCMCVTFRYSVSLFRPITLV